VLAILRGHAPFEPGPEERVPDDDEARFGHGAAERGQRVEQDRQSLARIEPADEQDIEPSVRQLGARRHIRMEARDVDAVRNDAVFARKVPVRELARGRRDRDAAGQAIPVPRERAAEQAEQPALPARRVERADDRHRRGLARQQRQRGRERLVHVHEIERAALPQRVELAPQVRSEREVDERALERHEEARAQADDIGQVIVAMAGRAAGDDRDFVPARAQFARGVRHVFGHAAVARIVRLRDERELHAAAGSACAIARAGGAGTKNGRNRHHAPGSSRTTAVSQSATRAWSASAPPSARGSSSGARRIA
jgi:hypothetical protein